MVAATTGVVLGLLGLAQGTAGTNRLAPAVGFLIIVLGVWGVYASSAFEKRAHRHRMRIIEIREELEPGFERSEDSHTLGRVWLLFHALIAFIGLYVITSFWP
jgi:hypothetical protein